MKNWIKRLRNWVAPIPTSLFGMIGRLHRPAATRKLYVLRVDFPIKQDHLANINANLEGIREKYGIDFIILEPGMTIQRFDDF